MWQGWLQVNITLSNNNVHGTHVHVAGLAAGKYHS